MSISSRGWLFLGAPLLAATLWAGDANADAAGSKVLANMQAATNRAKTQKFEYEATSQESGKAEKKLGLTVLMKGEKRFTEFTAPADMKGTKVLILSTTQMHAYLPAFGRVRRIVSPTTDQGFMGLAFSPDDFASQVYSPSYDATLNSESGTDWKITLTAKSGVQMPYGKIEVTITKDKQLPTELKYYSSDGKHVRTETRTGYTCEGNICTPGELKMVDHTKNLSTKMVRKLWKVNEELSDELFSKRNLEK